MPAGPSRRIVSPLAVVRVGAVNRSDGDVKNARTSQGEWSVGAMSGFEIVARQDFSDVTYLLEIRHALMARAARAGQFVIVMAHEHGERIPLTIADFDRDKGTITLVIQAVGKTTKEMQQTLQGRNLAACGRRPHGHPQPDQRRKEGDLRRRRPGRGADLSAGARVQGERRLCDRRAWIPQQGSHVLDGQVRRLLRRAHRLHGRRIERNQRSGHRRHRARHRKASPMSTNAWRSARR